MEALLSANAAVWNDDHNCFLSREHMAIAGIIQDYDPNLILVFVPPAIRNANDTEPFAIMHTHPTTGYKYVVRTLKESEVDHRILAWLWNNDLTRNSDILQRMEAEEAARRALELKLQMEKLEENRDFAISVLKGKNYYKHGGKTYQ